MDQKQGAGQYYCHQSGEVAIRCYSTKGEKPSTVSMMLGGVGDTFRGAKHHPAEFAISVVMTTAGVGVAIGSRYVFVACRGAKAIGGFNNIVHGADCVKAAMATAVLGVGMVATGEATFIKACRKGRRHH